MEWIYSGHDEDSLALQVSDFSKTGDICLDFDFHCDVFDEVLRKQAIKHFLQVLDGAA